MRKNRVFLTMSDSKNRVFDPKHTFGEIVMSKIMEMCNSSEKKKTPAACRTERKPLKSHFLRK